MRCRRRYISEYCKGLFDSQIQYPSDVVITIPNSEHFGFETPPPTGGTAHLDIRQKMHIHREHTRPLAPFAVPTGNIEREVPRSQVAAARLCRFSEDLADRGKGVRICRRVGPRCAANGPLVNRNYFVE